MIPDPSLPAVVISSIDPGGPADRYDQEASYWPTIVVNNEIILSVELT